MQWQLTRRARAIVLQLLVVPTSCVLFSRWYGAINSNNTKEVKSNARENPTERVQREREGGGTVKRIARYFKMQFTLVYFLTIHPFMNNS